MPLAGAALRQARLARNLTLKELAKLVGVSPSYLSKLERNRYRAPSPLLEAKLEAVLAQPPAPIPEEQIVDVRHDVDPRNKLNELTGKEWIRETKTVWKQRGLGLSHPETKYEKLHPAPFSFQDVARLIRFFTKRGMLVLDPFCGVGSTLKAAALEGRRGIGIELSPKWAELAKRRLREETPDDSSQQVWCADIREAIDKLPDNSVQFCVTSPPYWGILNKPPDHKVKNERVRKGLATTYSTDERDLGNIADYDQFLDELASIFQRLARKLEPGRYCAIIVSDFKHGEKYYSFHSNLSDRIECDTLRLQGITILEQTHKKLYPYGYPYAYVPNIHNQYILIFRRPLETKKKGQRRKDGIPASIRRAQVVPGLDAAISRFRGLPHRQGAMAGRHWGHPRHSICSFPSKFKPALASVLVDYFTTPKSVVLDPLAGSGTLPFEAALQGRSSIGSDLSTLAHVITSAKIMPPTEDEVDKVLEALGGHIEGCAEQANLDEMEQEIRDFYHEQTAREIVAARQWLAQQTDGFQTNAAALFVTACLAHILHGNRPYALSRRSHNIIPIPPKGPAVYKPVMKSLREKCQRMLSFPLPPAFVPGQSFEAAGHDLPLDGETVDIVITSPPFLGTTEFLRHNRVRNWLVGWGYETQARRRDEFLEHHKDVESYEPIFHELYRVMRPGALLVFHVGIVKTVSMADLLAPHFAAAGFREIDRVWERTADLESHGRTDRGSTHVHGFVFLRRT